jgi:hypothetical protein
MPSPLSVKKNAYTDNRKDSCIYTPVRMAQQLFEIVYPALMPTQVLDCGCGEWALSQPYIDAGANVTGIDITPCSSTATFILGDVLSTILPQTDLVVCNPPFNTQKGMRKLIPELWARHVFESLGYDQPLLLVTPMGLRLNQRKASKRYTWLRDCGAEITSIISLPIDAFPAVLFHAEVVLFNIYQTKPHYFLDWSQK